MSSENLTELAIALMSPGSTSISPIVPTVPVAGFGREALQLERRLGEHEGWVETQVHRRRSRVVASSVHEHVGVDVAGDRVDDPDPVPRVLQDTGLLDVHLDPAREVVERVDRLAPARRLVPCCFRMLPEAATVVDRAKRLPELLLARRVAA